MHQSTIMYVCVCVGVWLCGCVVVWLCGCVVVCVCVLVCSILEPIAAKTLNKPKMGVDLSIKYEALSIREYDLPSTFLWAKICSIPDILDFASLSTMGVLRWPFPPARSGRFLQQEPGLAGCVILLW